MTVLLAGVSEFAIFSAWMPPGGWLWYSSRAPPSSVCRSGQFSCCIQVQSDIVNLALKGTVAWRRELTRLVPSVTTRTSNSMNSTDSAPADLLSSDWHILKRRQDLEVISSWCRSRPHVEVRTNHIKAAVTKTSLWRSRFLLPVKPC